MPNFSDRFLAKVSGTDPNSGNTPNQVAETLRKIGVPLQERWDFSSDIDSVEKFYATIPPKLFDYAKQDFLDLYEFKHEYVKTDKESLKKALKASPIGIGVTAWFSGKDGIYYSPKEMLNNHWCVLYGYDDKLEAWKIFDSYDGYSKLYSYDSLISVAKRFWIQKKELKKSFKQKFLEWFKLW